MCIFFIYLFCCPSKCHCRQKEQLAPLVNAAAWVRGQRLLCCWEKCHACLTETWKWTYKIRSKLLLNIFIQMKLLTVAIMATNVTRLPASGISLPLTPRTSPQPGVGSKWVKFQFWLDYPCKPTPTVIVLTLSSVLSRTGEKKKKRKSWGEMGGITANISRRQSIRGISRRCQKPTPIRSLHSSRCINSRRDSLIDNYSYLQTSPVTGKQIKGGERIRGEAGGGLAGRGQWEDFYISSGARWEMALPPSDSLRPLGEIWEGW